MQVWRSSERRLKSIGFRLKKVRRIVCPAPSFKIHEMEIKRRGSREGCGCKRRPSRMEAGSEAPPGRERDQAEFQDLIIHKKKGRRRWDGSSSVASITLYAPHHIRNLMSLLTDHLVAFTSRYQVRKDLFSTLTRVQT